MAVVAGAAAVAVGDVAVAVAVGVVAAASHGDGAASAKPALKPGGQTRTFGRLGSHAAGRRVSFFKLKIKAPARDERPGLVC